MIAEDDDLTAAKSEDPFTLIFEAMISKVPKFDGFNAEEWISQIYGLFDSYNAPEEWRLRLVSYHMEGAADEWFLQSLANNQLSSWSEFQWRFQQHFGSPSYESLFAKLIGDIDARIANLDSQRKTLVPPENGSELEENLETISLNPSKSTESAYPDCQSSLSTLQDKNAAKVVVPPFEQKVFDKKSDLVLSSAKEEVKVYYSELEETPTTFSKSIVESLVQCEPVIRMEKVRLLTFNRDYSDAKFSNGATVGIIQESDFVFDPGIEFDFMDFLEMMDVCEHKLFEPDIVICWSNYILVVDFKSQSSSIIDVQINFAMKIPSFIIPSLDIVAVIKGRGCLSKHWNRFSTETIILLWSPYPIYVSSLVWVIVFGETWVTDSKVYDGNKDYSDVSNFCSTLVSMFAVNLFDVKIMYHELMSVILAAMNSAGRVLVSSEAHIRWTRLNFELAIKEAKFEGYKVEIIVEKDCNLLPLSGRAGRKGLLGTILIIEIVAVLNRGSRVRMCSSRFEMKRKSIVHLKLVRVGSLTVERLLLDLMLLLMGCSWLFDAGILDELIAPTGYGLGGSTIALFCSVGGGISTLTADIESFSAALLVAFTSSFHMTRNFTTKVAKEVSSTLRKTITISIVLTTMGIASITWTCLLFKFAIRVGSYFEAIPP